MSNWNLPTITSGYLDFVTEMNDKFVDAGTIGYGAPTNLPEHAMRFNRSINIFEEWVANAWVAKVIGIVGGGTGASDPATARVNLGLGSMATQNSNAVNITGGSITGVALDAGAITTGIVALARGGTGASLALGGVGTVLLSNGSAVVFAPGTSITQLNASNLTTGIVPLDRLAGVGKLDGVNQQWNGFNNFIGGLGASPYLDIAGQYPSLYLSNSLGEVGFKKLSILNYLGALYFQALDDAGGFKANYASITANGLEGKGQGITDINGTNITTGIVSAARLGAGPANAGTFLRGDNTWQSITPESVQPVPSGLIAIFELGCPAGWTRVASLDGRFPLGSTGFGGAGGSNDHTHGVTGTTNAGGVHQHYFVEM